MKSSNYPIGVLYENDDDDQLVKTEKIDQEVGNKDFKLEPKWINIVLMCAGHVGAIYGIYLIFTEAKLATLLFSLFMYVFSAMGITAGAHRLWSHRAYKATWQLKMLLMIMASSTYEGHIITWSRDHRVHHKHSDTWADPYSTARGFFFSHMGWLLVRKHPSVIEKGRKIDMSDLYNDPILVFQKNYYGPLMITFGWIIPTLIPYYFWDESIITALAIPANLRIMLILHASFLVNSVAHFYGYKPYDRNIRPVNNLFISLVAAGEGWHNYHHTFPWDYKTSELPKYHVNFTNAFIDFFAWIGWAYDLKTVSSDTIKRRVQRTGDGSHELWGWGDKDATNKDMEGTIVIHKK